MSDTTKLPKIEHCGNAVYAVHTEDGPAIYPTLEDALATIDSGTVEVSEGDREYYEAREWLPIANAEPEDETMTTLHAEQMARIDALDLYRLEPTGDDWQVAWEGVDLAREIRAEHIASPTAVALAALWTILKSVQLADRRLEAAGRTSADDNGDSASAHVKKCLDSLCGRTLRNA